MDRSDSTPSIAPSDHEQTAYIVVDDLGPVGRSSRETGADRADLEAIIMGMLEGQYRNPVRVVGFNTTEGWSKDVSAEVAHEVRYRCDLKMRDVPSTSRNSSRITKAAITRFSYHCPALAVKIRRTARCFSGGVRLVGAALLSPLDKRGKQSRAPAISRH
jgi:hypothetical protein